MQLLETSNSILLLEFIEVILHQELVLYDFPSVVLHMTELSVDLTGVLVGSWLFCIQHSPCLVNFTVHAQSQCGGLDEEYSILIHRGPNSFWHAKRC